MRYVRSARMWWVGLVVVIGLGVAQAQPPTPRASLTSIEQKVDDLQMTVGGLQTTVEGSGLPRYQELELVAFGVSEAFQGSTDLNGDGDVFDEVLHIVTFE